MRTDQRRRVRPPPFRIASITGHPLHEVESWPARDIGRWRAYLHKTPEGDQIVRVLLAQILSAIISLGSGKPHDFRELMFWDEEAQENVERDRILKKARERKQILDAGS